MNTLPSEKHVSKYSRIVIFRQSRIGDTLVTFPAIEALHQLYPNARLVYCTQRLMSDDKYLQGYDVVKLSPYVKEIVTYTVEDSAIKKYLKLKKCLKVSEDDLLIYLPYSTVKRYQVLRDWFFFKALNFKHMICFKENWNWTYVYENKKCQLPKDSERLLGFLRSAGLPVEDSGTCSVIYDKDWAMRKWNEWGLNGKKVLAICPFSIMQSKRWPIERYIKVGCEWHKRTGMSLVVIGGPADVAMANKIITHWRGFGFSACGTSLSQTAAILSCVQAYCGNDTGSMHLAAILGIPCVAIFSSRAPAKLWYPYGEGNIVLREDVDCQFCERRDCDTPPLCLDKISVEKVLDKLAIICKKITKG